MFTSKSLSPLGDRCDLQPLRNFPHSSSRPSPKDLASHSQSSPTTIDLSVESRIADPCDSRSSPFLHKKSLSLPLLWIRLPSEPSPYVDSTSSIFSENWESPRTHIRLAFGRNTFLGTRSTPTRVSTLLRPLSDYPHYSP